MSHVCIGKWVNGEKPAWVEVETFMASRALISANSGGGKSYLLRGVIEAFKSKEQQIIIDTDGEFASLREVMDIVICAPKGADAVAHPKTAALLCRRLLETKLSAVIDISELKVPDRHLFVKNFLEALMLAPKELWGPLIVHLDEAHIYCPERGQGESIAAEAVIDLACRGRKRGFCLVIATQRLAKLRKDAAAELLNRLTGRMGLDVDVKRAAFELGMSANDAQKVLPHLDPGDFFAYGPAIAREMQLLHGNTVQSSHPKPGVARKKDLPKPTAAIMQALPQLADLQKEADQEAKTLQDLRTEIANLRRDASSKDRQFDALMRDYEKAKAGKHMVAATEHNSAIHQQREKIRALERIVRDLVKFVFKIETKGYDEARNADIVKAVEAAVNAVTARVESMAQKHRADTAVLQREAKELLARTEALMKGEAEIVIQVSPQPPVRVEVKKQAREQPFPHVPMKVEGEPLLDEAYILSKPQQEVLNAIAWLNHKGIAHPTREMVSAIAKRRGGAYNNNLSALKTAGYIVYPVNGLLALTSNGAEFAKVPEDDSKELWEHWLDVLTNPQQDILKALLNLNGEAISREDLGNAVQKSGGAFNNNISAMATMGALYYPSKGFVALTKNVIP